MATAKGTKPDGWFSHAHWVYDANGQRQVACVDWSCQYGKGRWTLGNLEAGK